MLAIDDFAAARAGRFCLRSPSPALRMARGDVLAVVGGSGCGKSTLLEGIGLLLKPERVRAYALGENVDVAALLGRDDEPALAALRASRIGFVLQTGGLLPYLSCGRIFCCPRRLLSLPADGERVRHAIEVLSLGRLLESDPPTCRSANGSVWRWCARCRTIRTCCWPMNRLRRWIRTMRASCSSCSSTWRETAAWPRWSCRMIGIWCAGSACRAWSPHCSLD